MIRIAKRTATCGINAVARRSVFRLTGSTLPARHMSTGATPADLADKAAAANLKLKEKYLAKPQGDDPAASAALLRKRMLYRARQRGWYVQRGAAWSWQHTQPHSHRHARLCMARMCDLHLAGLKWT